MRSDADVGRLMKKSQGQRQVRITVALVGGGSSEPAARVDARARAFLRAPTERQGVQQRGRASEQTRTETITGDTRRRCLTGAGSDEEMRTDSRLRQMQTMHTN